MCLAIIAVVILGTYTIAAQTMGDADPDKSEIVIDEVAGQWIALVPVSFGAAEAQVPLLALWPGLVMGFGLFRLFDIWKPSLIGRADRRGDAFGVMLDDVLAGVVAAVLTMVLAILVHVGFAAAAPFQP